MSSSAPADPPATQRTPAPAPPARRALRPWNVILHNDAQNTMDFVVAALVDVVRLPVPAAISRMLEAHRKGQALVAPTHREHAELVAEQLRSKRLRATIEPVE